MTMIYALALAAAAFEDLDAIDRDVAVAASALGATAAPVDRRLRLMRCSQGIQVERIDARGLAVRCPGSWRFRVALSGVAATAVAAPLLVRRGDPVTVRSSGAGFVIETSAIATEDGAVGATVRIRLDGGTRQVAAIVTGSQEVSVGGLKLSPTDPLPVRVRDNEERIR